MGQENGDFRNLPTHFLDCYTCPAMPSIHSLRCSYLGFQEENTGTKKDVPNMLKQGGVQGAAVSNQHPQFCVPRDLVSYSELITLSGKKKKKKTVLREAY